MDERIVLTKISELDPRRVQDPGRFSIRLEGQAPPPFAERQAAWEAAKLIGAAKLASQPSSLGYTLTEQGPEYNMLLDQHLWIINGWLYRLPLPAQTGLKP